jgi:predicted nucleotidyltransferase
MTSISEMIQELDAYFVQDPAIHAAYLFGSLARNRQRPGSEQQW